MRTKRFLAMVTILIAVAGTVTSNIFRNTWHAKAQDQLPPTTVTDRFSFGMIGITQGQTLRLSVANTLPTGDRSTEPLRVSLTFLDSDGQRLRKGDGSIIRRTVQLDAGQTTFLDLNFDDVIAGPARLELRAVVAVQSPIAAGTNALPVDPCVPSVELVNNQTRRTSLTVTGLPAVQRTTTASLD
ncbi:MAG TPA: hypothetical protein VKB46_03375 [Pyrinomonadaceae bacterium]|nr:hypothetical protein [Pyrinomonadaceae bacterium]